MSIVVYLNMYNLSLVTSRCVSLVLVSLCFSLLYQFVFIVCVAYYILLVFYLYSSL